MNFSTSVTAPETKPPKMNSRPQSPKR